MSFGFVGPSSSLAHSQVSTSGYDTNTSAVQNGGLFSKEECCNLAKYT